MANKHLHTANKHLGWATATLAVLCLSIAGWSVSEHTSVFSGLIIRSQQKYAWTYLDAQKVESGALIPANTHTVFHLPETFDRIQRETLLGLKGKRVRYWGYCFPANYDPTIVDKRRGFPGLIFLSEKERAVRRAELAKLSTPTSIYDLPTDKDIQTANERASSSIRHQLDVFKPNTMCYIMSAESLAIGIDHDNDRLNSYLERELNTDPASPDSDSDGILDGIEYISGINPVTRDTDGDGLVDGIEDADWDGRLEAGETDPRTPDSDRDGLCDGMCRVKFQKQHLYIGEDKNLNGQVDEGETDPRKWSTTDDGISDQIPYYQCLAAGGTECP